MRGPWGGPLSGLAAVRRVVAAGAVSWLLAWSLLVPFASAASPVPTPDAGGDTRSAGEGPGLVGAPVLAVGGVLALGILAAGITLVYIKATGGQTIVADPPESLADDDRPGG